MYDAGKERVEDNLDIIRIVKSLLYNTATLRATLVNLQLHDAITKSDHLCIQLESDISMADHSAAEKQLQAERIQIIAHRNSLR